MVKTQINIGDKVLVAKDKDYFTGVVKAKHLFSYDIFYGSDYYYTDVYGDRIHSPYATVKRSPKRRVFWYSDNDFAIIDAIKRAENEDKGD